MVMGWNKITSSSSSSNITITERNFPLYKNYSINLFNTDTMTYGKQFKADGVSYVDYGTMGITEYIPVNAGDILYLNFDMWGSYSYDANKNKIAQLTEDSTTKTVTILNDGTAFVRISSVDPYKAMITKNIPIMNTYMRGSIYLPDSKYSGDTLAGKIWLSEGDSITWGLGANRTITFPTGTNYTSPWSYARIVADRTGMALHNVGTSGATMAQIASQSRTDSAVQRYTTYRQDADIITIAMGTNDTAGIVPLGTSSDTDITTFYGALNTLVPGLINRFPGKKIGFFTPLPRRGSSADQATRINQGYTDMIGRANAIKEICGKYSIPVLDLLTTSNINPSIDVVNSTYFSADGVNGDGLHPNYLGHKSISDKIEAFLRSL